MMTPAPGPEDAEPAQARPDATAPPESQLPLTAPEASAYIAEMAAELAAIARGSKLDTLAYLLDMVRCEAGAGTKAGRPKVR